MRHASIVLVVASALAGGCMTLPSDGDLPPGPALTPQAAMSAVAVGRSSKAELAAALGRANAIPFDSGHEVWVWRWPGADRTATRSATELVVLFDPSGRAAKVRIRPGLPPP